MLARPAEELSDCDIRQVRLHVPQAIIGYADQDNRFLRARPPQATIYTSRIEIDARGDSACRGAACPRPPANSQTCQPRRVQTENEAMQLKPLSAVNIKNVSWQETRFDDIYIKLFSFRDGVVFEIQKFDPDTGTFPHQHDFRQLRYILEGEFIVNGVSHGPGTLIDFPERQPYQ